MREFLKAIDRLLRGDAASFDLAHRGDVLSLRRLLAAGAAFGAVYGIFMGLYGVLRPDHADFRQMLAAMLKVPMLFLLTICVTFPSLYVFSALADCRAGFLEILRILLTVVTVTTVLLASFGPITGFFTLSTTSYGFMILLNIAFVGISGAVGLGVLGRALRAMTIPRDFFDEPKPSTPLPPAEKDDSDPATPPNVVQDRVPVVPASPEFRRPPVMLRDERPRAIFRAWVVLYVVVGAQMSWILRPFIGNPEEPFQWFRRRDSNFLEAVLGVLRDMLR